MRARALEPALDRQLGEPRQQRRADAAASLVRQHARRDVRTTEVGPVHEAASRELAVQVGEQVSVTRLDEGLQLVEARRALVRQHGAANAEPHLVVVVRDALAQRDHSTGPWTTIHAGSGLYPSRSLTVRIASLPSTDDVTSSR